MDEVVIHNGEGFGVEQRGVAGGGSAVAMVVSVSVVVSVKEVGRVGEGDGQVGGEAGGFGGEREWREGHLGRRWCGCGRITGVGSRLRI